MANIKLFPVNLWRAQDISLYSTQNPNFPAYNTQLFDFKKTWHSRHGAGSGWGYFYILSSGPSQNNKIDFDEGGAELTASLTQGAYTTDSLAAEIKTQMEAVGALTYTPEYIESGTDKLKFKITGSAAFNLRTNTGTNKNIAVWDTTGYSTTANKTGSSSYTADYIRIHSFENLRSDFSSTKDIYGVMIIGHNFQLQATVKAEFSNDNWASVAESISFTIQSDILILQWDSPKQYRYFRIWIEDIDNQAGYVMMGTVWVAVQFQPIYNFLPEMDIDTEDPSLILASGEGGESSLQEDHFDTWNYVFRSIGSTELNNFKTMFDEVGKSKPLMIIEDPTNSLVTTKYAKFTSIKRRLIRYSSQYWLFSVGVKEER